MTNNVYRERAHLVSHLAAIYESSLGTDPQDPDWPVVYIKLPTGQVSWHISPDDMDLFTDVKFTEPIWDGHDTPEKYRRLDEYTKILIEEKK